MNNHKIALINFHFAHNYGAVLQCLALQTVLEQLGNDVNIIDYHPYYQEQYYVAYPNPIKCVYWRYKGSWEIKNPKRMYLALRWGLVTLVGYRNADKRKKLIKAFLPFCQKNLHLTQRYNSLHELKKKPPAADIYVCGSDQLWNPHVTFGLDPAFYLDFGDSDTKRIAYAVSPCKALDTQYFHKYLLRLLPVFDFVSLRESEKKSELEKYVQNPISICVDPTLLLKKEDYARFEEEIETQGPYILVYAFKESNDERMRLAVESMSKILNYKVIDVSYEKIDWINDVIRQTPITPGQFLSYFKNAEFVVTNSFHGTAFSIIYEKQFISVTKEGTSQRMVELMTKLGLHNNLMFDKIPDQIPDINYKDVEEKRRELSTIGLDFLKKSISAKKIK
jgi:hypothetical protein